MMSLQDMSSTTIQRLRNVLSIVLRDGIYHPFGITLGASLTLKTLVALKILIINQLNSSYMEKNVMYSFAGYRLYSHCFALRIIWANFGVCHWVKTGTYSLN